jgi:hypothetical protein
VMVNKPQESLFSAVEKLTIAIVTGRIKCWPNRNRLCACKRFRKKKDNGLGEQRIRKPHRSFNLVDGFYQWMKKRG